ncbi:MAG TPA: STAS domain-containing protein, partial [Cellvibrio sp.]
IMTQTAAVIRMPKRFDYSSGVEFNQAILAALEFGGNITLDCSEMDYIDSAGIGLLVMAQKKVQSSGAALTMNSLKTAPKEILGLANIQKIIDIE